MYGGEEIQMRWMDGRLVCLCVRALESRVSIGLYYTYIHNISISGRYRIDKDPGFIRILASHSIPARIRLVSPPSWPPPLLVTSNQPHRAVHFSSLSFPFPFRFLSFCSARIISSLPCYYWTPSPVPSRLRLTAGTSCLLPDWMLQGGTGTDVTPAACVCVFLPRCAALI